MFRSSVQNLAGGQTSSISRFLPTINLSTCVYYSDLWFSNSPYTNKCQEVLCLVCRCLDQIYTCINRLLLRLHKVTCLLLRHKPARRNDLDPLPDILKDVSRQKMVSTGPDVIPLHHNRSTMGQECVGSPAIMSTAYSSHQLNIGGRKNHYSLSHLCYCNSSAHSHKDNQDNVSNITFRHHNNGFRITENRAVTHTSVTTYTSPKNNSRSTHSQAGTEFPSQIPRANQFNLCESSNNQNNNGCSHGIMFPHSQTCHFQSSSYENYADIVPAEGNTNQDIHARHEPQKSDSEITRDIVLALRRVGDSLDSKLRYENKKSLLTMMGATKICDDWFVFMTLGQRDVLVAMMGLSLELLHQFNRL
ncbi:hypothetical protein BsWGS_14907 [Bradybaena similaris]